MPLTIDVPVNHRKKGWSASQLAAQMSVGHSNACRYIRRLTDNGHEHFRGYERGDPLTDLQASVVIEFRRLSLEEGKRGDGLWRAIESYPRPPTGRESALREVCDRYGIAAEKVTQMIEEVMEIFEQ